MRVVSRRATLLLKRHALTPFAVPAGLGATVRCVLLMRAQALALQVRDVHVNGAPSP